jgi:hypothetical protein
MYLCIQANVNPKYFFNKATKIINPQANMAHCPNDPTITLCYDLFLIFIQIKYFNLNLYNWTQS